MVRVVWNFNDEVVVQDNEGFRDGRSKKEHVVLELGILQ